MNHNLKIGFVPLTDCAPLIVAKEQGFFNQHGLNVKLYKEASWSTIRDKLVFGEYDAAHLLAPMLMATTLGINSIKKPLVTAYSFGLNGNAISVSNDLFKQMHAYDPELIQYPERSAQVLKKVVENRESGEKSKLRFAVVFPFSMHYYLLNHWLKSGGLAVNEDVEILVVPPSNVVQAMEEGMIDGYCVGEPWNTHAVKSKVGVTVITGYEIWNNAPEKVLGVRADWAEQNQKVHEKLILSLYEASEWIDQQENRSLLIEYLSLPHYVGAPKSSIDNAIKGEVCNPICKTCRSVPNFTLPFQYHANFPWQSHAEWILNQMVNLNQISGDMDIKEVAKSCYLPDVYRRSIHNKGVKVPQVNIKPEGEHQSPWYLEDCLLGEDQFLIPKEV